MADRPAPPSGYPPPARALTPAGEVDLADLAARACAQYREEYPDEHERYGPVGQVWCRHDLQHVANWAIGDVHHGFVDLAQQTAWLAGVLAARDYPLDRLSRAYEILAVVVEDPAAAARLREVAPTIA